ncbi:peroxiredoxin family protein [Dyadobacter jiangsuensis]
MQTSTFKMLAFVTLLISCSERAQPSEEIVEIPVEFKEGFGPFAASYGSLSPEHTGINPEGAAWVPTYRPVRGIPKDLKNVIKSMVWLNPRQFVYQNFHEGKISREMYEQLQKSWEWVPDELWLSKKPIKSFVYVIRGVDKTGAVVVMIDTNNNLDFSDEIRFTPAAIAGRESGLNADSLRSYDKPWMVQYEHVINGSIVTDSVPIIVKRAVDYEFPHDYWYTIPLYGRAALKWKGRGYQIWLSNMFDGPEFHHARIFTDGELNPGKYTGFNKGIEEGEIITVGSVFDRKKFKYLGIKPGSGYLLLQTVSEGSENYSLQKGYPFRPFKAKDFRTGKLLALSDFKSKYVFIDFWGTWCGPCVQDLPELRNIYKETNNANIQFLGIVGKDSRERLTRFLAKNQLEWPQILSDSANKLVETYGIQAYPTTVLIGPDGKVVEKNLRGDALRNKLREISESL